MVMMFTASIMKSFILVYLLQYLYLLLCLCVRINLTIFDACSYKMKMWDRTNHIENS